MEWLEEIMSETNYCTRNNILYYLVMLVAAFTVEIDSDSELDLAAFTIEIYSDLDLDSVLDSDK